MALIDDSFEIMPHRGTIRIDCNANTATVYELWCYLQWRGWVEDFPWYKKIWFAWSAFRWYRVVKKCRKRDESMTYEDDVEKLRQMNLPVTHYIYCPRSHKHWPDLGGVFGALSLGEISPEQRREIIAEYMAEGRSVRACVNGPYRDIQPIYRAMQEGRTP